MDITYTKKFLGTPFIIETTPVENKPGTWNSTKVSIYRDEILIGEYLRNYHSFGQETFYPFQIGEDWYAVYSASYTATRIMKLHNDRIEDWCGEESHSEGFCPVEFYIPKYNHLQETVNHFKTNELTTYDNYYADCDLNITEFMHQKEDKNFIGTHYCNFGFLSGCIWGDDSNWKIQYIDLSKVPDKEMSITEKFGYWVMPSNMTLKECVHMDNWEPDHNWISLTGTSNFNLVTDEKS